MHALPEGGGGNFRGKILAAAAALFEWSRSVFEKNHDLRRRRRRRG
jgi:hypothetical protein